jgi:hypothetical protein
VRYNTANYGPLGGPGNFPLVPKERIRTAYYLKKQPSIIHFFFDTDLSKGYHKLKESRNPELEEQQRDLTLVVYRVFDYPDEYAGSEGVGIVYCLEILAFDDTDSGPTVSSIIPAGILLEDSTEGLKRFS